MINYFRQQISAKLYSANALVQVKGVAFPGTGTGLGFLFLSRLSPVLFLET
jgi:hypothetical protein